MYFEWAFEERKEKQFIEYGVSFRTFPLQIFFLFYKCFAFLIYEVL